METLTFMDALNGLVIPVLGFVIWELRSIRTDIKEVHKRITDSSKEQTAAVERTQKHILGCANFKLRDGSEGLIK